MKNDKEKFKKELKSRIYKWVLRLIQYIDTLPKGQTTTIITHQVIRSGTSVGSNYVEAQAASSKKGLHKLFPPLT